MLTTDFHPTGRHFLQIPGPSPVPDRVLRAMSLPTIDHRGPEFGTLGLKVNWYGGGYEGPGPLAGVINGAMAIAAGLCRHVLVFRTIAEASARRIDKGANALSNKTAGRDSSFFWQWYTPYHVHSAVNLA
eukprot:gene19967-39538_t